MSARPRSILSGIAASLGIVTLLAACSGTPAEVEATGGGATAPAEAREVTVTHAQGEGTVPVDPETVLVFDLASLDTLHELGVEVAGAPLANLNGDLADWVGADAIDVGTLFEPDYEAVNAARPDLIIVGGRSAAALPELAKIAPTIDLTNDATALRDSVITHAQTLGEIFDKDDEVAALLADLEEQIERTRAVAANAGTGLILLTTAGEVTAYGPGSRFGFLHDELGLAPADDTIEIANHGEVVSFEYVAETDPDWIFAVDRDAAIGEAGAAAQQVLDNELVHRTTAWTQDQVAYVDAVDWYIVSGGVGTLTRIAEEVATVLGG